MFRLFAPLLIALGISSAVVTFSVADSLLFKPLMASEPARLVRLVTVRPRIGPRSSFSPAYVDSLRKSPLFSATTGSYEYSGGYEDEGKLERISISAVDSEYFKVFGITPVLGRTEGGAVLSYRFWQSHYGGRPDILGRKVIIKGIPFSIVGVTPEGFNGATVETGPAVRLPLSAIGIPIEELQLETIARLAPHVNEAQAREAASALLESGVPRNTFALENLAHGASRWREQMGTAVRIAWLGATLLLGLACVNLSGLLLSRMMQRRQELAVRLALGASRLRLIGLVLRECAGIGAIGTALGLGLSWLALQWLPTVLPPVRMLDTTTAALTLRLDLDFRVFAFGACAGLATLLVMSIAPAWSSMQVNPESVLREARGTLRLPGWRWVVAIQTALCTLLLMNAAVIEGTLQKLTQADTGLAKDHLITFSVDSRLAGGQSSQNWLTTIEEWRRRVRQIPQVAEATLAQTRLFRGSGMKTTVALAGSLATPEDFMNTSLQSASPEYFATMGQRLREGRIPTAQEKNVAVVNLAFSQQFGKGQSVIGRKFGFGVGRIAAEEVEVVGVVTNARYRGMREDPHPTMYGGLDPGINRVHLIVRTTGRPQDAITPVREALRAVAPALVAEDVATMQQDIADSLWNEKALSLISRSFAILAIGILMAGIFGLMSHRVLLRRRELAVRHALGAQREHLAGLTLREALLPLAGGLTAGLALSWSLQSFAVTWLVGSSFHDLTLIATVALLQVATAILACLWPAWRAATAEPWSALREG